MNIERRDFLKAAGAGAAALSVAGKVRKADAGGKDERPNVVIFLADDMGWSDIGCFGGEIDTPNIDRLAERGLRFTQFYNTAKCGPSRACLLTGLYAQQVGFTKGTSRLRNCVTIGEAMRAAGYRTLMTGKWHAAETPFQRGFDRHFGLADGSCNYFNPGVEALPGQQPGRKYKRPRRWAIDNMEYLPYTPKDTSFYTTDAFSDYAVRYLEEYKHDDKPFLLYVAYTAPHYPIQAWPEDIAKYRGKYMVGWDNIRESRYKRQIEMGVIDKRWSLPPRGRTYEKLWRKTSRWMNRYWDGDEMILPWEEMEDKDDWDLKMAIYAAMIDRMDQGIGKVLGKIRELGKEDNTLVLFASDNGACPGTHHLTPDAAPGTVESYDTVDMPWANASNTPFRKYKVWSHEGGIATPFIASWPRVMKKGGAITHEPGHFIDVMATLLDVARAEYPSAYRGEKVAPLEGKSLLPVFEGKTRKGHDALFWQYGGGKAVRKGQWKLVAELSGPWELYDLELDRTETRDLVTEQPERVKEASALYDAWARRVGVKEEGSKSK